MWILIYLANDSLRVRKEKASWLSLFIFLLSFLKLQFSAAEPFFMDVQKLKVRNKTDYGRI